MEKNKKQAVWSYLRKPNELNAVNLDVTSNRSSSKFTATRSSFVSSHDEGNGLINGRFKVVCSRDNAEYQFPDLLVSLNCRSKESSKQEEMGGADLKLANSVYQFKSEQMEIGSDMMSN